MKFSFLVIYKYSLGTVGINTGYIKTQMTSSEKIDETYHKMLNGKDIGLYSIKWKGEWIKYDKDFVNNFGDLGRALPPEYIFTNEKILIQRTRRGMQRKLVCCYDDEKFYNLNRVSNVVVSNLSFSIKFIIGLLNSKLLDYYFNKVFNEYEVKPLHLSQLPIKIIDLPQQESIIVVVDKILSIKKQNPSADILGLETQIDQLVYQLYDLTEEEIKIIETT